MPTGARTVQVVVPDPGRHPREAEQDASRSRSARAAASTPSARRRSATTTIVDTNVPELHIDGGGHVSPGSARDAHDHRRPGTGARHAGQPQRVAGDAIPGKDYQSVNPTVVLPRGPHDRDACRSTTLATSTRSSPIATSSRRSRPAPAYRVGLAGRRRRHDPRAERELGAAGRHVASATTHLVKGQPYAVTIVAEPAISTALTINLAVRRQRGRGHRLHAARRDHRDPAGHHVVAGAGARRCRTTSSNPIACSSCRSRRAPTTASVRRARPR